MDTKDVIVETDSEEEEYLCKDGDEEKGDVDMFEDADSIIIDREELEMVEKIRNARGEEEKRHRMASKRLERSALYKLGKAVG